MALELAALILLLGVVSVAHALAGAWIYHRGIEKRGILPDRRPKAEAVYPIRVPKGTPKDTITGKTLGIYDNNRNQ